MMPLLPLKKEATDTTVAKKNVPNRARSKASGVMTGARQFKRVIQKPDSDESAASRTIE